jgi:hypothetical protein
MYMIRHGEKPAKSDKDQDGLSKEGEKRAEALVTVFGKDSGYNIQYILAEHPKKGRLVNATMNSYEIVRPGERVEQLEIA